MKLEATHDELITLGGLLSGSTGENNGADVWA